MATKETPKAVEEKKPEVKAEVGAEVVEVPTQHTRLVRIGDKLYDELSLLALIYNDLQKVKKAVI